MNNVKGSQRLSCESKEEYKIVKIFPKEYRKEKKNKKKWEKKKLLTFEKMELLIGNMNEKLVNAWMLKKQE